MCNTSEEQGFLHHIHVLSDNSENNRIHAQQYSTLACNLAVPSEELNIFCKCIYCQTTFKINTIHAKQYSV